MSGQGLRIETERLVLRPVAGEDFASWAAFFADPEATRHLGGPRGEGAAWRHFLGMAGAWSIQGFGAFSVLDKTTGKWLGWTGPWHPVGWPGTEVGWCFSRAAWGKGFATEAAATSIDWAFDTLDWFEVIHLIPPDNQASQSVARRLGSTLQRRIVMAEPFAGESVDLWSQSREQWRRRA
jgi:RimJ/RimL family protein N-acetyltransferase